ncbi:MAG TPA: hypothetical protein VFD82_01810 [Planctomycetota bacterium]|nr:hypothetical protein [Planctomycetota bacterium]
MKRVIPCLFALLASCASVEWSPPPAAVPTQWRHCRLFVGEHAMVLARDSDAADEVHRRAAAAAATIAGCTGRPPARGLLIALSAEDPLPVADPSGYEAALRRWQPGSGRGPSLSLRTKTGRSVEVDPAVALRLIAARVPAHDASLALPRELLDLASFVAIVPTDSCLDAVCSTLFDAAAEAEGVSSVEIALVSLVAGHPATLMSEQARKAVDAIVYESWLSALGADAATVAAVRARAGLPAAGSEGAPAEASAEELARYRQELERTLRRPHGACPFFVVRRPEGNARVAVLLGEWGAVVDLGPAFDESLPRLATDAGKGYERLQVTDLFPGRADAERLAAIHRRHGETAVLICTDVPEQAAALLAAHACFVAGADVANALEVARHYGGGDYLDLIEQKLVSERRSR